jgi:hypothetical protein
MTEFTGRGALAMLGTAAGILGVAYVLRSLIGMPRSHA